MPRDASSDPALFRELHRQRIYSGDVDFQLLMHELGVKASEDFFEIKPCVVVFTRSDDMETSELSLLLAREGVRLIRVNRDDVAGRGVRALTPDGVIHLTNENLRPVLAWNRHYQAPIDYKSKDKLRATYIHSQMEALPATISELAKQTVNAGSKITSRLSQVTAAQQAEFCTPQTVTTHDIALASEILGLSASDTLIVKPLGNHWTELDPETLIGHFPRRLSVEEAKSLTPDPTPLGLPRVWLTSDL
ncbi:hypothetical protein ODZ83_09330 [Acaricomes phytoseiuli]|uniref:hypothetical protein n=1 Tax=Acaricomes phytoseiuli TaxID=291968 RepID=UPI0022216D6D|nr:hypothetical protein [Acaricomes phytoseiuli]MCW1250377.1 hypothetical protein [Acaricomes phytoseiuli]